MQIDSFGYTFIHKFRSHSVLTVSLKCDLEWIIIYLFPCGRSFVYSATTFSYISPTLNTLIADRLSRLGNLIYSRSALYLVSTFRMNLMNRGHILTLPFIRD